MADKGASGRIAEVLDMLEDEAHDIFAQLVEEPPLPLGELRDEVAAYMIRLEREADEDDAIDLDMAEAIAESLRGLLEHVAEEGDEDAHRLVHAAVRYFILEEDAEDDLASLIGFDDDAEVVTEVAEALDRPDLAIDTD
jgi:uncharacterized membrane protein YkvA (DUF1232 family)